VKWNEEEFVFWTTKGTGLMKAYNKKELQKLPTTRCSHHNVTLKYERPGRYYMLIPLITKKKANKSEKSTAFDPGVRTFKLVFPLMENLLSMEREISKSYLSWERRWISCNPQWTSITNLPI
jgi:hypothetical protein